MFLILSDLLLVSIDIGKILEISKKLFINKKELISFKVFVCLITLFFIKVNFLKKTR